MNKTKAILLFLLGDLVFTAIAWSLFSLFRYETVPLFNQAFPSVAQFFQHPRTLQVLLIVPFIWLAIYFFSGFYNKPLRKAQVDIFLNTFVSTAIGSVIIFMIVLIDDDNINNLAQYRLIFFLFIFTGACVIFIRLIIASYLKGLIASGKMQFKAIFVGTGKNDLHFYNQIKESRFGYDIKGYVNHSERRIKKEIPSNIIVDESQLKEFIEENDIDEILINGFNINESNLNEFYYFYQYYLPVKVQKGSLSPSFGKNYYQSKSRSELIDLYAVKTSEAEKNIKMFFETAFSLFFLLILSPLLLLIALLIKSDSRGPVIYTQERLGLNGKTFKAYKFRSMQDDAESGGPALSHPNDNRVTKLGKILRMYRLDELPQFWNVVKGDMSIIGPRPEREYYIEKIAAYTPLIYLLQLVRPGITSQAAVENGYTKNVREMIVRTEIDIQYLQNASLYSDVKVLLQTIYVMLKGRGV